MRPDELGRRTPTTVFFDRALSTSKLRYHRNHQPKDQRTHAKSSKCLGKCYKPISYSWIYNASSLGIDCCLRSVSLVFCHVVDVICVISIGSGLIFRLISVFTIVIGTFHTMDTIGLCLLFERDCYLSQTGAYVGS